MGNIFVFGENRYQCWISYLSLYKKQFKTKEILLILVIIGTEPVKTKTNFASRISVLILTSVDIGDRDSGSVLVFGEKNEIAHAYKESNFPARKILTNILYRALYRNHFNFFIISKNGWNKKRANYFFKNFFL